MKLELIRHAYLENCTLGYLYAGPLTLATIGDRWAPDPDGPGGQRREPGKPESCPPDGTYRLANHSGTKWKNVWALVNPALGVYRYSADIPAGQLYGRSDILLHSGVDENSSLGCIIVGRRHGIDGNRHRVYEGPAALDDLRTLLNATDDTHSLLIRPTSGTLEKAA